MSAFSRYFRRHTGVPFVQYVNRLRINLACQLLMSGELNITDICYQVGFNNLSNFNRQFLLLKEMSPSRWRAYQQLNAASATESPDAAHASEALGSATVFYSKPHLEFQQSLTRPDHGSTCAGIFLINGDTR